MNRLLAWAPLVALLALVAISAFLLLRPGERETVTTGEMGRELPAFDLPRLGGGDNVTHAELAGRAHLINVFASWCTPCRAEHGVLTDLHDAGVEIIGVAYKDRPEATQAFIEELGDPFAAIAIDRDGRYGLELGMAGAPETFVIGPDGRIRAVHRGPLTREIVEREILPALAAP